MILLDETEYWPHIIKVLYNDRPRKVYICTTGIATHIENFTIGGYSLPTILNMPQQILFYISTQTKGSKILVGTSPFEGLVERTRKRIAFNSFKFPNIEWRLTYCCHKKLVIAHFGFSDDEKIRIFFGGMNLSVSNWSDFGMEIEGEKNLKKAVSQFGRDWSIGEPFNDEITDWALERQQFRNPDYEY